MRATLSKLATIVAILSIVSGSADGQSTIRGFVSNAANGEPIEDANVIAQNDDGVVGVGVTNNDGVFVIPRLSAGTYIVVFSHIGFVTRQDTVDLGPAELISLEVELDASNVELRELIVNDNRVGGAAEIRGGLQTIKPADIDLLPSPDVSGDLVAVLNALPGVVSTGDQGGQLFIRGGEPSQNLVMIDGIVLYQPFHLVGFYSAFSSDIVASADVYAGGFGAKYGGRLSSVIDISSRNGNLKQFESQITASPFVVGAQIEGPIDDAQTFSYLLSTRHSVVEDAASQYVNEKIPYRFNDIFGKIYGAARKNGRVSLTGIRTYDRGLVGKDVGLTPLSEIRYENEGAGLRYLYLPGAIPVLAEFLLTASRLTTSLGDAEAPEREATASRIDMSTHITSYSTFGSVEWGLFARTLQLKSDLGGAFQDRIDYEEFLTEAGIYGGPKFLLKNGMVIHPSIRIHSFPSKDRVFVEPRFRFEWERENDGISGAFGVYHQEIVGVNDRRDATSIFTAWSASPRGQVPRAFHAMIGYTRKPISFLSLSSEVYYKDMKNLFIAEWTAFPRLTTRLQLADGNVYGLDLRAEVRTKRFYGYVNYGLSSVRYGAKQESLRLWFGTETFKFRPAHDRRHQVNVVGTTTVRNFDFSAKWQFGSGLPFNRAQGFDGFVLLDSDVNVFNEAGDRRVIYERPFNGVLPTYHRLDLSVDRTFRIGRSDLTVQLSAINAYDRSNVFYLDVFTLRRADQFPFIPSLGIKANLR
ncbi:MAG: TonB-dependent receptor [Rhodothermales bacterium]|nr:TonB-dependent receptor [Rhodothermales bacterium]